MTTVLIYRDLVMENLDKIYTNRKIRKEVEKFLFENYGISKGDMQEYFNNPEKLNEADLNEVALIGEQIYQVSKDENFNLKNHFKDKEIENIHQFYKSRVDDDLVTLPLVLENVNLVGNGSYSFPIDWKLIARLFNSGVLNYNYDIQRAPKHIKRQDKIEKIPQVNQTSVKQITKHLLEGTLIPTNIVYNATLGTSHSSEELIYDSKERTLTITAGTRLDILDGMHRTLACVRAYDQDKETKFNFIGLIFNFNTRQAQQYQAQLAKANPIPKSRIQELEEARYSDSIVKHLRLDSELKDKISSRDRFNIDADRELVSYGVLANAIEKEFQIKNKLEGMEIADYIADYMMYLFGYFEKERYELPNNLMFYNKMFAGHIKLAARMRNQNVPLNKLKTILDIDFNRNSEILQAYGLVDKDGKIDKYFEKKVDKLFGEISIEKN